MVKTLQVTIGAATTQVSATSIQAKQVLFQNNAANAMRVGDSNTSSSRGAKLLPNSVGTLNAGFLAMGATDLSQWYVNGTQNDVLDIVYLDPN